MARVSQDEGAGRRGGHERRRWIATPTETKIVLKLTIEGPGPFTQREARASVFSFDHMLELFTRAPERSI